jgi:hypothetical protein
VAQTELFAKNALGKLVRNALRFAVDGWVAARIFIPGN